MPMDENRSGKRRWLKRKESGMTDGEHYLGQGIPKLGFGFMRLPKRALVNEDMKKTCEMVDRFMDAGQCYFDTAPLYDMGKSERAIKEAVVDRYPRESFYLATKCNATILCRNEAAAKKQLLTSLERTGAGYFDFYLLHGLMGGYRKYDDYGLWDYVREQKEKGLIRHWGFSFHGGPDLLDRLLTDHPDTEFVQLQINYKDWDDPRIAARANYEAARAHGVPVIVMEPVKGGSLADLPEAAKRVFRSIDPDASMPSWAIRFAASLPGVITVLSGMSNLDQVNDNVSYMQDFKPLDARERAAIQQVRAILGASQAIPCTACRYCVEGCPQHIAIPEVFAAMNRSIEAHETDEARIEYASLLAAGSGRASECIACGACEEACTQHIPIVSRLAECADVLE